MDCRRSEGEDAHREIVRSNLWLYMDGRNFTPEDLLSVAWYGGPPWMVKLEGEALQGLVKLAALEVPWRKEEVYAAWESMSFGARRKLRRLAMEGGWHDAMYMIRHPEMFGPVGDVLDLGWTLEGELCVWIAGSEYHWSAYEGVQRLLASLCNHNKPIPDALLKWAIEVAMSVRSQPTKGNRPASETYRDGTIVQIIRDLTALSSRRRAGSKKLTRDMACQLIGEELHLEPDTIQKIWQKGKSINNPQFIAPAARPF